MSSVHAQIRYQVIDERLRNHDLNHWYHLAEACSLAANEYGYDDKTPSKRTINYDIERMRSGVLGYEAPIAHDKNKGYYYSHKSFSIFNVPLSKVNTEKLRDAIFIFKQWTQNEKLLDIHQTLTVLEDKLQLKIDLTADPAIYLEHSTNELGQNWLDTVYTLVKKRQTINIKYQPFEGEESNYTISPAFIHEYNNRWYLYGYEHHKNMIVNLALDRFKEVNPSIISFYLPDDFSHDTWFIDLYGVTKMQNHQAVEIEFWTKPLLSKYINSKTIHSSQKQLRTVIDKAYYSMKVHINYEVIHKFLSFGADLVVTSPPELVQMIKEELGQMVDLYGLRCEG